MIKRLTTFITTHRRLVIGISSLIVLIGLAGGVWWTNQRYQQSVAQQATDFNKQLEQLTTDLANTDIATKQLSERLLAWQDSLAKLQAQNPTPPHILSLVLATSDQQKMQQDRQAAFHHLEQQLELSIQLATYQAQVAPFITELQNGSGQTKDQQTELAKTWQQAHQQISNIIVPQPSQNFSQELLKTIQEVADILGQLAELNQPGNQAKFLEEQAKLTDHFDHFAQLAIDHHQIVQTQDQSLWQAIERLQKTFPQQ